MPSIAILTSSIVSGHHPDDTSLAAELTKLGIAASIAVWNDPAVEWHRFDAVVFRSTWDYFKHHASFLRWLDALDRAGIPAINSTRTARWNADKRYLLELEALGIPIVPSTIVSGRDLERTLATFGSREVVVKPTVSGTAWHTLRGVADSPGLRTAAFALPRHFDYVIQPFIEEIVSAGELSLIYIGSMLSHAVVKRPQPGDYRVQGEFGGSSERLRPDAAVVASANRVLTAAASLGHGDLAYARVDGVVTGGAFLLMELELIEPYLHLSKQPDAARNLGAQIAHRMGIRNLQTKTSPDIRVGDDTDLGIRGSR